jgi:hypothetical protein
VDQFVFQADSQSSTPAQASATDAATLDISTGSSTDAQSTAVSAEGSADNGVTNDIATNSQPISEDAPSTGSHMDTAPQAASASPAGSGLATADTFVFAANFGNVTLTNFDPGTDVIEIDHTVFADFQALLAATQDDGNGNSVITADPHDTITIKNVTVAQLIQHQGDFHFT